MGEIVNSKENISIKSKDHIQNGGHSKIVQSKESIYSRDRVQLKRKVTLLNAITLVAGSIIGSGIFISPKGVYENCGHSAFIALGVWLFCGIFSLIGALCFAELGTTINKSGGEYTYILEAYGDLPAFLYLWVGMFIVAPTARTIMALTFASYFLSSFSGNCQPDNRTVLLIAASCLCLLTYVNCVSVKFSMKIQDFFTIAKFVALTIFMGIGIYSYFSADLSKFTDQELKTETVRIDYSLIPSAIYSGLFAYGGWNSLNAITEELINPYKNLPRAIFIGTLIVTITYLAANASYFIVLTPAEIINSPSIGTVFAQKTIHDFAFLMPVAVAIFVFGCINGGLFTASRVFYSGAMNDQLPKILAMISIKNKTPSPSLIFSCLLSLMMLVTSNVYTLIDYFSFSLWFWTGIATSTVIVLRFTRPELERPIKYSLLLPITFTSACILLTLFSFYMQPMSCIIGILVQLLALPFYYVIKIRNSKKFKNEKKKNLKSDKYDYESKDYFTLFVQKILLVVMPEADIQSDI